MSKSKTLLLRLSALGFLVVGALVFGTHFFSNSWLLVQGDGYEIPRESSIFWFKPIEMNTGSGDWWIYGEDRNFYYYDGDDINPYVAYPKEKAKQCAGFKPTDYGTWCQ